MRANCWNGVTDLAVETGEVVRSDGSPEGMGPVLQEPARPAIRGGDATATSSGQR
jgi:hypothetical protein